MGDNVGCGGVWLDRGYTPEIEEACPAGGGGSGRDGMLDCVGCCGRLRRAAGGIGGGEELWPLPGLTVGRMLVLCPPLPAAIGRITLRDDSSGVSSMSSISSDV
jgi:hypothetical protein